MGRMKESAERNASRAGCKTPRAERNPACVGQNPAHAGQKPAHAGQNLARAGQNPACAGQNLAHAGQNPSCAGGKTPLAERNPARVGRGRLFVECVLLYVGLPAVLAFLPAWIERRWGVQIKAWVVPTLLVAAAVAYVAMRRTGLLARGELTRLRVADHLWAEMLARFVLSALLLTWLLSQFRPEWLFAFPRHNPRFWALVCVAYPLVSVLPQGILYRALFEKRYAACVPRHPLLFGALLFSWAHVVFHNPWACAFTFVGGLFFLSTYRRTGSLLFSGIEHALYGDFLFTIGWGSFFYEGTQAAMRAVAP